MGKRYYRTIICLLVMFAMRSPYAWNKEMPGTNVLVFASFSMPKESLKNYLIEARKIQAPLLIRGLINNSFKDTTKAVMALLPDNKGGMLLDPTLFKRFNIKKVPAVVVIDKTCLLDDKCADYDVIYGNVTLAYALKKIAQQGSSQSSLAAEALKELEAK